MATSPRSYTIDSDTTAARASVGRQALRREVNERAADASRARGDATVDVLCECGLPGCAERFTLLSGEYEEVRRFATHFLIKPGHEAGEERVVGEHAGSLVVEKFGPSGLAAVRFDRRRRVTEAR